MTKRLELYNVVLLSNGAILEARVEKAEAIKFKQNYGFIGRNVKIERARRVQS